MERIEGLSIGLNLDALALDRGLTGLKDKLKTVDSEMKANLSSFDRADKSVEKYETRLTGLNKKLEVQKRVVQEAKAEYEKMVKEYGEGSKEAEKAARQYNNQAASLNNLQRYVVKTSNEFQEFKDEIKKSESGITNFGNILGNVGGSLTNIGKSMSSTVTPAIGALGIGLGSIANTADASSKKIQRSLGLTAEQAKELTGISRELWKEGMGDGVEDVDKALLQVRQNMRDLSDKELKQVTKDAMYLAETFDSEVNEVTRAGNNIMKSFGITSEEAFDLMAWGGQKGLNFSNEMFDNLSEYGPLFAKMGFSAEDYFQLLEKGSSAGVYNLDYINDVMKEFQIRVKDGSKTTANAMGEMSDSTQEVWKSFLDGEGTVKDVHNVVLKELKGMDDQVKANEIGVGLYGVKWEDLESDAMYAMGEIDGGLKDLDGAMNRSGDGVERTFGERAKIAWKKAQDALLPLGETLLDISEEVLPPLTSGIEWATDKFNEMSPAMKQGVVIVGGLTAAIGPLAMAFGGVASMITPLLPMLGGAGGFTALLAGLSNPIGWTILGLAGLSAGFIALDSAMDKPIIKSDIFKGEISEATKEAVGSYMELDENATAELNNLAWSSQTITDEMANNMVTKYQQMGDQVLQAMKENHDKQLAEQQRLFAESDILTEEEEAKRLAKLKADQLSEQEAHNKNQARIKEIWTLAAKEKRGITDAEAKVIAKLQEGMRTKAVQELSKSKLEQETILKNLKSNKGIIEAETAANTVKKSIDTRDKVVKEANKEYKEKVAYAKSARDDLGIISAKEANEIIKEAERKRSRSVSKAEDMHDDVVREAKKQARAHVNQVDWETGEVLSGWDTMYNGVIDAVNWIRKLFGKDEVKKSGTVRNAAKKGLRTGIKAATGYADGTPSTGHPGGPAIVGEEGVELGYIPGQGVTLLGTNGPEFFTNFPKGSSVLPNKQTERILKGYGFPGYADGIGDYFDMFLKGAGSVWDFTKGKFNLKDFTSILDRHTGSPLNFIGNMATDWIKGLWDSWFGDVGNVSGSVGSGVQRWAGLATKALMIEGQYSKANLDRLLYQMQTESGGNPRAINLWDINAKRGTPSMGLLQTIMPTYQAYKHPQFDKGPYDPMSNILASIRYAMARYGSLARAYRGVGYETGGLIGTSGLYQLAEGGWPEWVIPTDPSRRTDAMKLLALAGKEIQGNKRPHQLPNLNIDNTFDVRRKFDELTQLVSNLIDIQQNQLAAILAGQTIVMNDRVVGSIVESHVTEQQNRKKAMNEIFKRR